VSQTHGEGSFDPFLWKTTGI